MRVHSRPTAPSTSLGTGAGSTASGIPARTEPHPLAVLLFGKRPPRLVDRRRYPKLKKALKKLELVTEQISEILGVSPEAFSVELCEGDNASISRDGQIAVGVELLEEHQEDDDFLVAVLGHEIGHQPWSWPDSPGLSRLSRAQLDALFREEEAKADRFAGRVLAELGLEPDAICAFLLRKARFEAHPPSDYYPAQVRIRMIREAFRRRKRALKDAARLSPRLAARARELR